MAAVTVGVLFGGVSSEHEVSLASARSVIENIPKDRFRPVPVGITRDGRWLLFVGPTAAIEDGSWESDPGNLPCCLSPDRSVHGLLVLEGERWRALRLDAVFPVLHGKNGEDGTVQGLLELSGLPCVGSGVLASAACLDKAVTNTLLDAAGIPHADWRQMDISQILEFDPIADGWERDLGYPIFVKPANAGSSVGISKAHNRQELREAVELAFRHDRKLVAERCIVGRELECAVIGNLSPTASPVSEIIPKNEFYDYDAKYLSGSRTVLPAEIPQQLTGRVQELAVKGFLALGCRGFARVDFLYETATDRLYLNEPNTLPGFTSISMYPKMMAAAGLAYPELIAELIRLAMEERDG